MDIDYECLICGDHEIRDDSNPRHMCNGCGNGIMVVYKPDVS